MKKKIKKWFRKKAPENVPAPLDEKQSSTPPQQEEACVDLPFEDSGEIPDLSPVDPRLFEEKENLSKEEILAQRIRNAPKEDILFGKIAFTNGFLNQQELSEGVQAQIQASAKSSDVKPLGQILMDLGYLDQQDIKAILAIQKRNLAIRLKRTGMRRRDYLFGQVAIKKGFATKEQVNACIRQQAELEKAAEPVLLGELLINAGYLTPSQLNLILEYQQKTEVQCLACQSPLVVYTEDLGKEIECPICEETIRLPKPVSKEPRNGSPKSRKKRSRTMMRTVNKPVSKKAPQVVEEHSSQRARMAAVLNEIDLPAPQPTQRQRNIERDWYVALGGKSFGPVLLSSIFKLLKKNIFRRNDFFWHEVLDDWKPAAEIPEFCPYLQPCAESLSDSQLEHADKEFKPLEQIKKLAEMKAAGIITPEEFADAKKLLLSKI